MLVTWTRPADWSRRSAQLMPAITTKTMTTTRTEKAAAEPREECRHDQRQRHPPEGRAAPGAQALRGLLDAGIDLLEERHRGADARRAVAEDVAGDDDERRAGERQRRIVEGDQVRDADDGARQGGVDHRDHLHGSTAGKAPPGH